MNSDSESAKEIFDQIARYSCVSLYGNVPIKKINENEKLLEQSLDNYIHAIQNESFFKLNKQERTNATKALKTLLQNADEQQIAPHLKTIYSDSYLHNLFEKIQSHLQFDSNKKLAKRK